MKNGEVAKLLRTYDNRCHAAAEMPDFVVEQLFAKGRRVAVGHVC